MDTGTDHKLIYVISAINTHLLILQRLFADLEKRLVVSGGNGLIPPKEDDSVTKDFINRIVVG